FTYQVADNGGLLSNVAMVTVTVLANQPPVAVNFAANAATGAPTEFNVLASVTEPDDGINASSLAVVGLPTHGSAFVDFLTNEVSYQSNPGFIGTDTFTYQVADNGGSLSNIATVTVTVQANQPPVAGDFSVTAASGVARTFDLLPHVTEP